MLHSPGDAGDAVIGGDAEWRAQVAGAVEAHAKTEAEHLLLPGGADSHNAHDGAGATSAKAAGGQHAGRPTDGMAPFPAWWISFQQFSEVVPNLTLSLVSAVLLQLAVNATVPEAQRGRYLGVAASVGTVAELTQPVRHRRAVSSVSNALHKEF